MVSYSIAIGLQLSSFADDEGFGAIGPGSIAIDNADAVELERRRFIFWTAFMTDRQLSSSCFGSAKATLRQISSYCHFMASYNMAFRTPNPLLEEYISQYLPGRLVDFDMGVSRNKH
jgi:hypothetical protein